VTDYTDNFERFWKAYPKRNGQKRGKKPAFEKSWKKLTTDEKRAAYADVEKRNRHKGWGKYIRDAERYLRDHGWEDEWFDDGRLKLGQLDMPEARAPEPEVTWQERMLNRLFVIFINVIGGVESVKPALAVKHEALTQMVPALAEDMELGNTTKQQAARDLAEYFVTGLDVAYGLACKDRVLRAAALRR